jgi:SPP1 family predicted phage head-tail adaptor
MTPISTSLHDNVPTTLRGLRFLALSDTGYILRGTVTDNQGGGGTYTFGTVGTVDCRVEPIGGGEGVIANRVDERTTHRITTPPGTDVNAKDRFQIVGIGEFEITAVDVRTDEQVHVLEAVENF